MVVIADIPGVVQPAGAQTTADAQALVERAVAHVHDVGRDKALADFSRPDGGFVDGALYVFCQDASGVVVAHGGNPRLVGRDMSDVRGPGGRMANVEINRLGLTKGGGWLEFRWPNPATKRIELKHAYVLKVDDRTVCGSGYYTSNEQCFLRLVLPVPGGDLGSACRHMTPAEPTHQSYSTYLHPSSRR
jgi:cytochrome c